MHAEILTELKNKALDKTFTYNIPHNLDVKVGTRVIVPFGKQKLEGFVLKINKDKNLDYELKDIIEVIDEKPVITKEMLELGVYISKKTLAPLITCYQTMLPKALKAKVKYNLNKKYETYLEITNIAPNLKTENQKKIYDLIKNNKKILKKEASNISTYTVKSLLEKGYIKEIKEEAYRLSDNIKEEKIKFAPTENQKNVINSVDLTTFTPYLLHGVTGSGKTLVYIKLIEQVLKMKKEAILLVPEISLTPQTVKIFKQNFGKTVAILHSALSDGEKYDEWRKIEEKKVSIAIGARSAIFAPFNNLGIIIIDEEHSATYKQENTPKYNTIDVSIKRAKTHNCPILLGSATPSIESYTRAKANIYKLLKLTERINQTLPEVELIDMKNEFKKGNRVFSGHLKNLLNNALDNHQQAIILLNRRGFTTVMTCKDCGYTHKCPNCDIPLTYHKTTNSMKCHYCNYTTSKPEKCPSCHSQNISSLGMGTEKLEELLKEEFPKAKVVRMDVDTTKRKGMHAKIIEDFKNKKYNILIGTQMISKGLDFPDVTVVGVINGDSSLNIPDFKSSERTYDLLNQIAGRAGRADKKGQVIIQGFNMDHYSIVAAANHDYETFYNEEIKIRKKLKYPPFYNLCHIKIASKDFNETQKEASKIANYLKKQLENAIILGPASASMPKINNIYYFGIIIKYKNTKEIIEYLRFINTKYKTNRQIKVEIDLNPIKI